MSKQSVMIFAATRIYRADTSCDAGPLLNKISRWVECSSCCDGLLVAYPMHDEFLGRAITTVLESKRERLMSLRKACDTKDSALFLAAVPVPNWVGFTPALNALMTQALVGMGKESEEQKKEERFILFSSLEMVFNAAAVQNLVAHLNPETDLVVGPELVGYHRWSAQEGEEIQLAADNIPWNTMALWDLRKLSMFGFLPVSDGHLSGVEGGMEEVATICLAQMALSPDRARAKLLRFGKNDGMASSADHICVWDILGDAWLDLLQSGRWQPLLHDDEARTTVCCKETENKHETPRIPDIPEETASQIARQCSFVTARVPTKEACDELTVEQKLLCDELPVEQKLLCDELTVEQKLLCDELTVEDVASTGVGSISLGTLGEEAASSWSVSDALRPCLSQSVLSVEYCDSTEGDAASEVNSVVMLSTNSYSMNLGLNNSTSRFKSLVAEAQNKDSCLLSLENHYVLAEKIAQTGMSASKSGGLEKQRAKVKSKQKRAQSQMEKLPGLRSGRVIHMVSC